MPEQSFLAGFISRKLVFKVCEVVLSTVSLHLLFLPLEGKIHKLIGFPIQVILGQLQLPSRHTYTLVSKAVLVINSLVACPTSKSRE